VPPGVPAADGAELVDLLSGWPAPALDHKGD